MTGQSVLVDASVIIVGSGPAGLSLAGELRLAGVGVIVLERLGEPTGQSRGLGFTIRTAEIFDQRGLLAGFGEIGTGNQGHFGGVPLDLGVLGAAHSAAKTVPQSVTEAVLADRARELGVDLRRGQEVEAFVDHGDHVEVTTAGGGILRCHYLVGCDGGRSTVRRLGGFDFPGTPATTELFLADIRGVDLDPRMTGQHHAEGMVMAAPLGDGVHRIIVCERGAVPRKRVGPPPFTEIADAWKRITGIDIAHAEPLWVSAFGDGTRQVTEYRRGRVLLAGDAAHVHLPAGGQGMNVSIQDAVNLGWKLAAVARGTAPESLLDSYHDERHEVGRRLLLNTRAQASLILGGAAADPLRQVLAELTRYDEVSRHLAAMVSGLDIRYDVGGGTHPLLGRRMPHTELLRRGRATSTTVLLRAGRPILLDLDDNARLRSAATPWTDRVDVVTAAPAEPMPVEPATAAVLIRPDGHVAWAAPGSHHSLCSALDRWFGPARPERTPACTAR
ncbi:FAD-dependent monooxygenase [Lentzea sp. NPDC054927]